MKVIAFTLFAIVGDEDKFLKAGFNGYIFKPFNTKEINKIIEGF
jgi:CheY-like chemotaxis protein